MKMANIDHCFDNMFTNPKDPQGVQTQPGYCILLVHYVFYVHMSLWLMLLQRKPHYCYHVSIRSIRYSLAAYQPGLFQSQVFFGYAHALAPLVAYAPQGSPRGLSTERR